MFSSPHGCGEENTSALVVSCRLNGKPAGALKAQQPSACQRARGPPVGGRHLGGQLLLGSVEAHLSLQSCEDPI